MALAAIEAGARGPLQTGGENDGPPLDDSPLARLERLNEAP